MNVFLRIGQAMPHIKHANTTYIKQSRRCDSASQKESCVQTPCGSVPRPWNLPTRLPFSIHTIAPNLFLFQIKAPHGPCFFYVSANQKGGAQ
ncbi:hypothetical protein SAMN05421740_101318 [Parapedobacter koreensis]|uniref:Uncharacterized protein n=1 Tax=Parapedobacter koreensis TaxID=332977 RepID=A0A1H7FEN5_9SPHI|nr:hypothetical protein SAMN05421740_101318 [Parapedobacter koreensis]